MNEMHTNTTEQASKPMSFRADPALAEQIERLAAEEQRSVSNVIVYIVNQYLSSTKGKLIKNAVVVDADLQGAGEQR